MSMTASTDTDATSRVVGDVDVMPGRGLELDPTTEAVAVVSAYADDTALVLEAALVRLELDARWLAHRAGVEGLRLGLRRHLAGGDVRTAAVIDRALRIATSPEHGPATA